MTVADVEEGLIPCLASPYFHLSGIVEQMEETLQEICEQEEKILKQEKEKQRHMEPDDECIKFYVESCRETQLLMPEIRQNIWGLLKNEITVDKCLSDLLKQRFILLTSQQERIADSLRLSGDNANSSIFLPTSKNLYEYLVEDDMIEEDKAMLDICYTNNVRKFELFNLLIREIFNSCRLNDLSDKTIQLLRASPQLHPILTGTRKDLGHPDEAYEIYSILERMVLPSPDDLNNQAVQALREILEAEKYCSASGLARLNALKELFSTIKKIVIQNEQKQQKVLESLNELRKNLDVSVYAAHFRTSVRQEKRTNCRKGRKFIKTVSVRKTDYEVKQWPHELPDPDFLSKEATEAKSGKKATNQKRKQQTEQQGK